MRAVIQRVKNACVTIEDKEVAHIGQGMLILLGVKEGDDETHAQALANKIMGLRIFTDANDKMNLSPADIGGEFLVVSNFTLYGSCKKGRRPSFIAAARPESANMLYEYFADLLREGGFKTQTGAFGADMQVSLCNDGPVTLVIESEELL